MPPESDTTLSADAWRWRLRLLASADLVGSTAFKVSRAGAHWAPTFREFFADFPSCVDAQYATLPQTIVRPPHPLRPWKFLGDEILFWAELTDYREAASHILALKKAVATFPDAWSAKEIPLRLKATAWLAGFPVTNTEIRVGADTAVDAPLDFIGPSIDLGFRIARFCDARRFVLSADLALMILDAVDALEIDRSLFRIHLEALEPLKGVIGNEAYPILWLDMRDGKPLLEERLLGISRDFRSDDLKDYLRCFIDEIAQLRRPFIDGDLDPRYGAADASLKELREEMMAEESNRHYLNEGEADKPPQGEGKEPREPPDSLGPADAPSSVS